VLDNNQDTARIERRRTYLHDGQIEEGWCADAWRRGWPSRLLTSRRRGRGGGTAKAGSESGLGMKKRKV
jgi:hypothetical protein